MNPSSSNTEAELERFREQWRQEVSERSQKSGPIPAELSQPQRKNEAAPPPATSGKARESTGVRDYSEDIEPRAYHDLPDKEEQLKLGEKGQNHDRSLNEEPTTALEHYERAVDKETTGQLGDSLRHYRTAFKLDDGVHEAYKRKHFPPSSFAKPKPTNVDPSNAAVTVPNTAHHSLHGGSGGLSASLKHLVDDFSTSRIQPRPPPTEASPQEPCHVARLPEEILTQILINVAISDVAAFARLARVCKRFAYLVLTEEAPWKAVALGEEYGFPAMHYDFACDIEGFSTEANDSIARYLGSYDDQGSEGTEPLPMMPEERAVAFSALTGDLLHQTYASSWRQMFRSRPRIRFNGCYISTVNYTRPGATSTNTLTWGTPVHVVTYFRYLRFFRDGTVISLLSTAEPADVVHHLTKENLHHAGDKHSSALPSSVMKGALPGRWRLSGPASSSLGAEGEGDVHVETEGVVPRLTYKLLLTLAHAGKGARNNKLAWKGFWSYNRLTDDWGEFGLRNDRAFYWSRVKSYGSGL